MRQDILNRLRDDAVEHNGVTLELHTPDVGWAVFSGCRVPAALTAEGLIVANHLPDAESIAALAEVTGIDPKEWQS